MGNDQKTPAADLSAASEDTAPAAAPPPDAEVDAPSAAEVDAPSWRSAPVRQQPEVSAADQISHGRVQRKGWVDELIYDLITDADLDKYSESHAGHVQFVADMRERRRSTKTITAVELQVLHEFGLKLGYRSELGRNIPRRK